MRESCQRAVELGLRSITFTEHADFTPWVVPDDIVGQLPTHLRSRVRDGLMVPPALDVPGYLAEVRRCQPDFPQLSILTGVELSEPHWYPTEVEGLLRDSVFQQLIAAVHALPLDDGYWEVSVLMRRWTAPQVLRAYLAEVERMVSSPAPFTVLAHIDYPLRYWPDPTSFDPAEFEAEFRAVLSSAAATGRVLEVNTRLPTCRALLRWWRDAGGTTVALGSDAHAATEVGRGFHAAAEVLRDHGLRPSE
jgi:histidinol-phosphatase (PHP family)